MHLQRFTTDEKATKRRHSAAAADEWAPAGAPR